MVSDTFAIGNIKDPQAKRGQIELAKTAMSIDVQRQFNMHKGSIPPRTDVPTEGFDPCARLAMKTVSQPGAAYPGFNMANTGVMASSIMEVISAFWNDPDMKPEEAARELARSVAKAAMK